MPIPVPSANANKADSPTTYAFDRTDSSEHQGPSMFRSLKQKFGSGKRNSTAPLASSSSKSSQSTARTQGNPSSATRRPAPTQSVDGNEPPPAYSPVSNAAPLAQPTINLPVAPVADDPYAFLTTFDTVFLIDDSGSMAGGRWRETLEALSAIAPICTAHDADGIDIYFLNHGDQAAHHHVTSAATVREIFSTVRPRGGTPTGQRLSALLKPYLRRLEGAPEGSVKPMNVICITDGEPSDDVESPLIAAARKLDRLDAPAWQVGVQFFQVGRDEEARRHLRQLDDELAAIAGDDALRDIVDTVPFTSEHGTTLTADGILKVVLGAVNRRLDRKRSKDLHR